MALRGPTSTRPGYNSTPVAPPVKGYEIPTKKRVVEEKVEKSTPKKKGFFGRKKK